MEMLGIRATSQQSDIDIFVSISVTDARFVISRQLMFVYYGVKCTYVVHTPLKMNANKVIY